MVLSGVATIVLLRRKEMKFHNYVSTCSPQPQTTQGQSIDSIPTNILNPATSGHTIEFTTIWALYLLLPKYHLGIAGIENALWWHKKKERLHKVIVTLSDVKGEVRHITATGGDLDCLWGFMSYLPLALMIEIIGKWELGLHREV